MVAVAREVVADDDRLGRALEAAVDAVVAQDAVDLGDVEGAVAPGDAVGHAQAAGDGVDALGAVVAVAVDGGVDDVVAGADVEDAVGGQGHGAGAGELVAPDFDLEAWREAEGVEGEAGRRRCGGGVGGRCGGGRRCGALGRRGGGAVAGGAGGEEDQGDAGGHGEDGAEGAPAGALAEEGAAENEGHDVADAALEGFHDSHPEALEGEELQGECEGTRNDGEGEDAWYAGDASQLPGAAEGDEDEEDDYGYAGGQDQGVEGGAGAVQG